MQKSWGFLSQRRNLAAQELSSPSRDWGGVVTREWTGCDKQSTRVRVCQARDNWGKAPGSYSPEGCSHLGTALP